MSYLENIILFTLFIFLIFALILGRSCSAFIDSIIDIESKGKANKRKTVLIYVASYLIPLIILVMYFLWISNGQFSSADKELILSNLDGYLYIIKWGISSLFIIAIAICTWNMIKGIYRIIRPCRNRR